MTDLKSYELPELEALAEQITAEIAKREQEEADRERAALEAAAEAERRAIAEAEAARRAAEAEAARKAAEATARAEAKAAEAAQKEAAAQSAAAKVAEPPAPGHIRYMHPSNRALTWDGKGATPDWVQAWLTTGGTLYALETTAEKLAPRPIPASFLKR
ncbi:H-NS family nucleoid-associated regulatory protein [Zoogloea sp.]|jgi:DNA-binding protein H-NS|uniref:H-NS family nucleoid-associated regulatory protein n=1 Tax=Zoogloea sp. TaxID=49181 RepID=UPI002B8191FA|nr:H-NS family nucleoid-associated regulatory protein [Zoogloea sp.]HOY00939.1 H-NS family nucleoid-associated regulatory protein [Zoogloea sp.]HPI60552.1 H-NS family nucleoid-associated regulatory protein [Zoogloea sp.]